MSTDTSFTTREIEGLLKRHGIHAPLTDGGVLKHGFEIKGTQLRIDCLNDTPDGPRIFLSGAKVTSSASLPLDRQEADGLVAALRVAHALPAHAQELKTLKHLVMSCSDLHASEDVRRLRLTLFLRENDYRIISAEIAGHAAHHARERLEPHAHDQGAVYDYRPTARLKNPPK